MINFYQRFLRDRAQDLAPLTNALTHLVPGAAISLAVDASDSHIGAVLQQHLHGSWSPLTIFSKKLSPTQSKHSAVLHHFQSLCLSVYLYMGI